ncbi:MAG: sigma 54-interacting transcriptional regulator [Phycisphaerae bacterium]|jgi:PAS domain S-box-containing protein|nr:sigma 54-interacting transcriptional regulator [Phycisphaerae bacterium]
MKRNARFLQGLVCSRAVRIVLLYAAVSAVWIFFSDILVEALGGTPEMITRYQTLKGLLFVATTSAMLLVLIRWSEATLTVSESNYRRLVDNMSESFLYRHNTEGAFTYISPSITDVLGYSEEEFLTHFGEYLTDHPVNQEVRKHTALSIEGVRQPPYEVQIHHKDGSVHWLEVAEVPVRDSDGRVVDIEGIAHDITERKRAEEALRDGERRLRATFNQAFQLMGYLSTDGTVLGINEAALRFAGIEESDVVGKLFWETPWWTHSSEVQEQLKNAINQAAGGRFVRYETTHLDTNGEPRMMDFSLKPVTDADDVVVQLIPEARDITERKRDEEALRDIKTKFEAVYNHHYQLTGLMDPEGRLLMSNKTAQDFAGVSAEEIAGKPFAEAPFWTHSKEEQSKLLKAIDRAADGEFVRFETTHVSAGGETRTFDFCLSPVFDDSGRVCYIVPEGYDITDRKQAEGELRDALSEIEDLKDRVEAENVLLRHEVEYLGHGKIVGDSASIRETMAHVADVAETDSTVLILGETGTGKELLARAIHDASARKDKPLVIVNCAAMPATLIENELFGREKGAYTDALTRQIGRFELADGATIFLDEIGELPLQTQSKLLRVLQEGQFERLGSTETMTVDVRVIAATNRDLEKDISEGQFREDLFYRLNVFPITVSPLRERREDIPALVWAFVGEFSEKMGKRIETVSQGAMTSLQNHPWPGNVRELRNVIERAMIQSSGPALQVQLPQKTLAPGPEAATLDEVQKRHIVEILERTDWRVRGSGGAAEILGLKPSTLESRMAKLGIRRPGLKPR